MTGATGVLTGVTGVSATVSDAGNALWQISKPSNNRSEGNTLSASGVSATVSGVSDTVSDAGNALGASGGSAIGGPGISATVTGVLAGVTGVLTGATGVLTGATGVSATVSDAGNAVWQISKPSNNRSEGNTLSASGVSVTISGVSATVSDAGNALGASVGSALGGTGRNKQIKERRAKIIFQSKNRIKFYQLNCRKSSAPSRELMAEITKTAKYIGFITEPCLVKGNSLSNYNDKDRVVCLQKRNLFYSNKGGSPRAAIIADTTQDVVLDPEYSSSDLVVCKWQTSLLLKGAPSQDGSQLMAENSVSSTNSTPSSTPTVEVSTNNDTAEDITTMGIDSAMKEIYLCSLYWDINKTLPKKIAKLLEYVTENDIPIILTGDTNAHSFLWHSRNENARGKILQELLLKHNMDVLNNNGKPTFESPNGSSVIDISVVSDNIKHFFRNWINSDKHYGSDHHLLTFEGRFRKEGTPQRRNLRKANWTAFRQGMEEALSAIVIPEWWNKKEIDRMATTFHKAVEEATAMAAPLVRPNHRFKLTCWSEAVAEARRNRNRLHKRFLKERTKTNRKVRDKANKEVKKELRRASRKHWQETTSDIKDPAGMAKLVRGMRNGEYVPPTLLKKDNVYTKTREETINLLLDTHFDGSQEVSDTAVAPTPDPLADRLVAVTIPFHCTPTRVANAIKSFDDFKASGPDGIKPIVLKNLPYVAIDLLSWIFAACMKIGYVPERWRNARTVFIPKADKGDYTLPRSYRPITLTSFCFKTLERLQLWRLETNAFVQKPMHKEQYAFRKGHSTEGALTKTVGYIESALAKGNAAIALFLDIEGAFDNISTSAALAAMKRHRIPEDIIKWYGFYLDNRYSTVTLSGTGKTRRLVKGTPQGGVLSPILWNLAFDSLLDLFTGDPQIETRGYADDACLVIANQDPRYMEERIQRSLHRANSWAKRCGLKLSVKKTVAMVFCRSNKISLDGLKGLYLGNHKVEYVESTKYLGVTLDTRLDWRCHLQTKTKTAIQLFFMLKKALGTYWGPKPNLIKWIYTGMVRPAISYGCLVWGRAAKLKGWHKKFRKINSLILRMMAPQRRATPIASMELMTYTEPIDIFLKKEMIMAYYRNKHLLVGEDERIRPKRGHIEYIEKLIGEYKVPEDTVWDRTMTVLTLRNQFKIDTNSFEKGEPVRNAKDMFTCYTDGSKYQNQIGAGVVIYQHTPEDEKPTLLYEECFSLRQHNTVYQAELAAVKETAQVLLDISREEALPPQIYIMSDCRSVLETLQGTQTRSLQVKSCINTLNLLCRKTQVTLRWIKAHVGHVGNEKADELAKQGAISASVAEDRSATPLPNVPAPLSYLKNIVRKGAEEEWHQRFVNETYPNGNVKHRQTKHFWVKPDRDKSKALLKLGREELGYVFQFITGHTRFQRHEAIIARAAGDYSVKATCTICLSGEETPIHLIHECGPVHRMSRELFEEVDGNFMNIDYTLKWSVRKLMDFIRLPKINSLFTGEEVRDDEPPDPGGTLTQMSDSPTNESISNPDDPTSDAQSGEEETEEAGGWERFDILTGRLDLPSWER